MDLQTLDRECRKQRALERLGTNNPVCTDCGQDDWRCLERWSDQSASIRCRNCQAKAKPLRAKQLISVACPFCGEDDPRCAEDHHIAGRKYDDMTVRVCRNCHRKLSDMQRDHPR